MYEINLIDETFDINQSSQCILLIETGSGGFSYTIFDTLVNKFVLLKHYPVTDFLINAIETDELLPITYKSVKVLLTNGKNTLVPSSFFDLADQEKWASFNLGNADKSEISNNLIQRSEIVNVYQILNNDILKIVQKFHEKVAVYHRITPLIENLLQLSGSKNTYNCIILINNDIVDIAISKNNKLEFSNTFEFQEIEDIVYYVLNVAEHFNINSQKAEFYFSANVEKHEEIFERLSQYFSPIRFIKPTNKYIYSYLFDDMYLTRFANLFNLSLCE